MRISLAVSGDKSIKRFAPIASDLPTTKGFWGASRSARENDMARSIPCGQDLDRIVGSVKPF